MLLAATFKLAVKTMLKDHRLQRSNNMPDRMVARLLSSKTIGVKLQCGADATETCSAYSTDQLRWSQAASNPNLQVKQFLRDPDSAPTLPDHAVQAPSCCACVLGCTCTDLDLAGA